MSAYTKIQPCNKYTSRAGKALAKADKQFNFFFPQQQMRYQKITPSKPSITPNATLNNTTINSSFSMVKKEQSEVEAVRPLLKSHRTSNSVQYNKVSTSLNETLKRTNKEVSKLLSTSQRDHIPFINKSALKLKQASFDYHHLPEKKSKCLSAKPIPRLRAVKKSIKGIDAIKTPMKRLNKRTLSTVTNNNNKDTTISSEANNKLSCKSKGAVKGNLRQHSVEVKKEVKVMKRIKAIHDKSKTGLNGNEKKVNQDSFFIFNNFNGQRDYIYLGVCDGHGCFGNEVSGFIKENLPIDLNLELKKQKLDAMTDDIKVLIHTVFIEENKKLLKKETIDCSLSGTTCVSAIYTPEKLIVANIGDSRGVLGAFSNKTWITHDLSRDHKPTEKDEANRILKKGRIRPMLDENEEFVGPLRVYMKEEDIPGLAMTRSFGDYYASLAGVVSLPEVTEHKFLAEDKFIIFASDGLFEFISSQEVVSIAKDYYLTNDIVGCCEFLYEEAKRRWLSEEQDAIDDITMIVVFFD